MQLLVAGCDEDQFSDVGRVLLHEAFGAQLVALGKIPASRQGLDQKNIEI